MHCIHIKLITTDNAIKLNLPHHCLDCNLSAISPDLNPNCQWLEIETDYFGGCGEQSAIDNSGITYDRINKGLESVFHIKRNEFDGFDQVGLGKYRDNNDFFFVTEEELNLCRDRRSIIVWRYGSRVYGSHRPDSDWDYIVIASEKYDSKNTSIQIFTEAEFQLALQNCDILALECYYNEPIYKKFELLDPNFKPNPAKMRISISTITSNSWVKAKKKLTISGDYDLNLAIKSTFHSLRILDYACQILTNGKIIDWKSSNWILDELEKMSKVADRDQLWLNIDTKFRKLFNQRSSDFKKLAPKDLSESNKITKLKKVLLDYSVYSDHLLNAILQTVDN